MSAYFSQTNTPLLAKAAIKCLRDAAINDLSLAYAKLIFRFQSLIFAFECR